MLDSYLKKILTAQVYDVAVETPLVYAPTLSARLANRILLKREDVQSVFSFKLRGAYNKIATLNRQEREAGIIAVSAGNHAQGVGLAARRFGLKATIVMPRTTPSIKVHAVRGHGATTILHGDSYDDAYEYAMGLVAKEGLTFVHPYDDPDVIAGQGTVGMEILRQNAGRLDAIFVPVGGGGLIAGITAYVKALRPNIRVIGVEPDDSYCLYAALQHEERVLLKQVGLFADGVAVRQIGAEPFRILKEHVDDVILVSSDEICAAIKDIFDDTRSIVEPAGALAVAGMKRYIQQHDLQDHVFVAINSGANTNFDRLRHVAERAEFGEHREIILAATIPERPGSFLSFCQAIGQRLITEFNYRYADSKQACVFVGLQLQEGDQGRRFVIGQLQELGYPVVDMTENEMAKLHIRYMVGGKPPSTAHEVLYRFEFPERPGALLQFLTHMSNLWNISLFHYRNHGAAYGRVLVGLQLPEGENLAFQHFLDQLGYRYWEETANPAYHLFLANHVHPI